MSVTSVPFCSSCMCISFESVFHLPCVNASMIVDVGIIVLIGIWLLSVCILTTWNSCGIYFCTAVDGSDCWRSFTVIVYTVCSRYFGINMTADATAFSVSMAVFQPDWQFPSGFLSCTLRKPSGISGAGFYEPDTQQTVLKHWRELSHRKSSTVLLLFSFTSTEWWALIPFHLRWDANTVTKEVKWSKRRFV